MMMMMMLVIDGLFDDDYNDDYNDDDAVCKLVSPPGVLMIINLLSKVAR